MVKKTNINIREIFLGLQSQMLSKLTVNRKILSHPVAKGDACELEWIDMLSAYLPSRYRVDKAFVIDCKGNLSHQIDIVIFDRHYSPFILKQNGANYIPAESVYAVMEVKQTLNERNVDYAAKKAESVRQLQRTSARIVEARGTINVPKAPFNILAGILTVDGRFSIAHKNKLSKFSSPKSIQFGCSLKDVSFWLKKEDGKDVFIKSDKGDSLIFFFLNLVSELQRLGTVPAIDLACYIEALHINE